MILSALGEREMFTINRENDGRMYLKICKAKSRNNYVVYDYQMNQVIELASQLQVRHMMPADSIAASGGGPWFAQYVEAGL